jgi:hypothetical protein
VAACRCRRLRDAARETLSRCRRAGIDVPGSHGQEEEAMRRIFIAVAVVAGVSAGVATMARADLTCEVRPFVGAFVPTGPQRDILKDALFVGAQGAVEMRDRLHFVGTLAWAPNKTSSDVCVYSYDVGVETFRPYDMNGRWQFRPFVGGGIGGRTYVDHGNNSQKETNLGGYAALGSEFQLNWLAIRLEGRDYATRFKGLLGNQKAEARNDVALFTGVAVHW